jgi:hypothetical protein
MIRAHGLTWGRVELSHDPQDYVNAISLTTSPLPVGLGLDLGPDELTEVDRIRIFERTGILPPEGAGFADSQAVRIIVELERDDPALIRWRDFRTRILPSRRKELERTIGMGRSIARIKALPEPNSMRRESQAEKRGLPPGSPPWLR